MPFNGRSVHLTTRSPSATTVQYTVSSAPDDASKLATTLRGVRRLLNLVLAIVWSFISVLQLDDTMQLDLVTKPGKIYDVQQWWIRLTTATDWGKGAWVVLTVLLSSTFLWALVRRDYVGRWKKSIIIIRY